MARRYSGFRNFLIFLLVIATVAESVFLGFYFNSTKFRDTVNDKVGITTTTTNAQADSTLDKIENLQGVIQKYKADLNREKEAHAETQNMLITTNARVSTLQSQLSEQTALNAQLVQDVADITSQKSELETQLANKTSELESAQAQAELDSQTIASLQSDIETLNTNITTLTSQKSELETQLADKTSELESAQAQAELDSQTIASLQSDIETLNSTITTLTGQKSELETQLADKTSELESAQAQAELDSQTIASLQSDKEGLESQLSTTSNELIQAQADLITANSTINQLSQDLSTEQSRTAELESLNGQQETTITNLTNRISELEQIQRDLEDELKSFTLADFSWQGINKISIAGWGPRYFSVGDQKLIQLTTGEIITVAIMGFDHDDLSDGTGKAGITFAMTNLLKKSEQVHTSGGTNISWSNCNARKSLQETHILTLPQELQSVIKMVDKKTTAGDGSSEIITTSDNLWLFSKVEIDGTTDDVLSNEGTQYDFWADKTATQRIYLSTDGSRLNWWTRSPGYGYEQATSFYYVSSIGGLIHINYFFAKFGICYGFCI